MVNEYRLSFLYSRFQHIAEALTMTLQIIPVVTESWHLLKTNNVVERKATSHLMKLAVTELLIHQAAVIAVDTKHTHRHIKHVVMVNWTLPVELTAVEKRRTHHHIWSAVMENLTHQVKNCAVIKRHMILIMKLVAMENYTLETDCAAELFFIIRKNKYVVVELCIQTNTDVVEQNHIIRILSNVAMAGMSKHVAFVKK